MWFFTHFFLFALLFFALVVCVLLKLADEKKGKLKIYDEILNSKEQILMNRELMQLHDPDISGNIKMNILDRYDEKVNPINKLDIMKV